MEPRHDPSSLTVALMTPRGRGAIATVRFVGDVGALNDPEANLFRAVHGKPLSDQPIGHICFGYWGVEPSEEVVACRVDETTVDIHCHGGEAAARRIVGDLKSHGCICRTWQSLMAHENGVFVAECQKALAQSTTARTAAILLEQSAGLLESAIEGLRAADRPRTRTNTDNVPTSAQMFEVRKRKMQELDALLRWSDFGLHLTDPWSVVFAGPPNVGKSSLINALVGYTRTVVCDRPGTTRDVVTTQTALDGWPVRLSDTAGLRPARDPLESFGIESARRQFARADCRVLLFDVSQPLTDGDRHLISEWPDALLVAHKCDLPDQWTIDGPAEALCCRERIERVPGPKPHDIGEDQPRRVPVANFSQPLRVSSLTGEGIATLLRRITEHLVPEQPKPGTAIPITERHVQLLRQARNALEAEDIERYDKLILQCLGR